MTIPDSKCLSKYAIKDSFDPNRNGPICLTPKEIAATAIGANPGQTVPVDTKLCPSGWAHASADPPDEYGDVPQCVTLDEANSFRTQTTLTPNANVNRNTNPTTRMAGNIHVKIHEL